MSTAACLDSIDSRLYCRESSPTVVEDFTGVVNVNPVLVISNLITAIIFLTNYNKILTVTSLIFQPESQLRGFSNSFFFQGLPNLEKISLYPPNVNIYTGAFQNLVRLRTFTPYPFDDKIGVVQISYLTKIIGDSAFFNTSIEKVEFETHSTMEVIGLRAFSRCPFLTSVVGYPLQHVPALLFADSSNLQQFQYFNQKPNIGCYLGDIKYVAMEAFSGEGQFICVNKEGIEQVIIGEDNDRLTRAINSRKWC
jgi:hypothetical protein